MQILEMLEKNVKYLCSSCISKANKYVWRATELNTSEKL